MGYLSEKRKKIPTSYINRNIFFIYYTTYIMATRKKPTMAATSRPRPRLQNFHLVWLDGSNDAVNNDDCRNSITKLRQVVNTVNTFTDVDECIDFITDTQEETTFMIVSGALNGIIVPIVQE